MQNLFKIKPKNVFQDSGISIYNINKCECDMQYSGEVEIPLNISNSEYKEKNEVVDKPKIYCHKFINIIGMMQLVNYLKLRT